MTDVPGTVLQGWIRTLRHFDTIDGVYEVMLEIYEYARKE